MSKNETEELIKCPFDGSHMIIPARMGTHLIKCKRNHPNSDLEPCDYNRTHYIKRSLKQAHHDKCPDRKVFEPMGCSKSYPKPAPVPTQAEGPKTLYPPQEEGAIAFFDEDWDAELAESSYNPAEHMAKLPYARQPPPGLLGKAARKKWRQEDNKRVMNLKEGRSHEVNMNDGDENANNTAEVCLVRNMNEMSKHIVAQICLDSEPTVENQEKVENPEKPEMDQNPENPEIDQNPEMEEDSEIPNKEYKEIIRKKRYLEKRLVAIARLEAKEKNGVKLEEAQKVKIMRKEETLEELSQLLEGVNLVKLS